MLETMFYTLGILFAFGVACRTSYAEGVRVGARLRRGRACPQPSARKQIVVPDASACEPTELFDSSRKETTSAKRSLYIPADFERRLRENGSATFRA